MRTCIYSISKLDVLFSLFGICKQLQNSKVDHTMVTPFCMLWQLAVRRTATIARAARKISRAPTARTQGWVVGMPAGSGMEGKKSNAAAFFFFHSTKYAFRYSGE